MVLKIIAVFVSRNTLKGYCAVPKFVNGYFKGYFAIPTLGKGYCAAAEELL